VLGIAVITRPITAGSAWLAGRARSLPSGINLCFLHTLTQQKTSPRDEFRQRELVRINASVSLAEKFRELKSLTVRLSHYTAGGTHKRSEIKYTVDLAHAKSAFSFACPNSRCFGGDFDLSEILASAVAAHLTTTEGEMRCHGSQTKTTSAAQPCESVLRYKLSLKY